MIRSKELIKETGLAICNECGGSGKAIYTCCGDNIKGTIHEDYLMCPTCHEHIGDDEESCENCKGEGTIEI